MSDREDLADSRFACTRRERAVFEAGIKMGTIYHQFVGTPFNVDTIGDLEGGMNQRYLVFDQKLQLKTFVLY